MNLPDKTKKFEQHNFRSHADATSWLRRNGFKQNGYVTEEPWITFFVERWEKENLLALKMDISPFFMTLPVGALEKPYQVDIATVN